MRTFLSAALAVALLAPAVLAHGGTYRGPRGIPPTGRVPTAPPGVPTGRPVPTMPAPPATPPGPTIPSSDGPFTDPGATPGGTIPRPATPGFPGQPTPGLPTSPRAGNAPAPAGPGPEHWVYWWLLNRERILDLRGIQTRRLASRTETKPPHFLGEEDEGNLRPDGSEEAREEIFLALLAAAQDPHADVATGAIIALGKASDPRALPLLMELVEAPRTDRTVSESAALAVGMIHAKSPEVRAFLSRIAADPRARTRTRAFATLGLGFLGDAAAIPDLVRRWQAREASFEVPACALVALGLLGDELIVPDLARAVAGRSGLREPHDFLRAYAAAGLGMLRSRAALAPLLAALRDSETEVRRQAVLSLGGLAKPEDETAIRALAAALAGDRDGLTRCFAAVSLGEIGSPLAADALLYAYRKGEATLVPFAALGLGLLARNAGSEEVRERIAPFLRAQLLERRNSDLQGALAVAAGIAGDRESAGPLAKLFASGGDPDLRGHAAVALGLLGVEEALPALRAALEDGADPDVQREVALALGLIGDREAVEVLVRLVKHGRTEFVRGSAAVSVGRLATPAQARALREVLGDRAASDTTRAFVAVALGLVMDRHEIPLLSRLGEHFNHRMTVDALAEVFTFL